MRKLSILAILTVTAVPTVVRAAPAACTDPLPAWFTAVKAVDDANKKLKSTDPQAGLPDLAADGTVDCMKDDVLVINGDTMVNGKPLVTCSVDAMTMKPKTDDCKLDYALAAAKAVELMGAGGSWDQLVIFGQQISASSNPPGPLFYRDGFSPGGPGPVDPMTMMPTTLPATIGVNEIDGIGLPKVPRVMGHPYVGYIAAGGTNQMAKFADGGSDGWMKKLKKDDFTGPIASFGACGKAPKTATDAPQDQPAAALCFPSFYNYFDALAQASASMYGPYLKGPKDAMGQVLSVSAIIGTGNATASVKGAFVSAQTMPDPADPTKKVPALDPMTMKPIVIANAAYLSVYPHFWNSFLDTGGSLFAGNTYRNNANGTYETTKPTPFYGINVPFPAGWKAGTILAGSQVLRFQPLDLYAMGLMAKDDPAMPAKLKAFMNLTSAGAVYRDGRANPPTGFDKVAGPQMGQRTGLVLRPGAADSAAWINTADIFTANGERVPAYAQAPHVLKQLWVVVSKPVALNEFEPKDNDDLMMKRAQGIQHLQVVAAWRRQFAAYYYMLTQYRGRVINTVDGVDDNAYYEFGNPDDDKTLVTIDPGVEAAMNGWEPAGPSGPDLKNVLAFTNVPGNAGVTVAGKVRIIGDQAIPKAPINAVSVRMRVPVSAAGALKGATATLNLNGVPPVRIPPAPATLVADGAWHTYVAALNSAEFKGGTFDGFSFSPSDKAYTGEPIEVEFIRIANVPSTKDADKIGQRCGACNANPLSADAKKKCSAACTGHDDTFLVQVDLSDGWVDSEDNCPAVYNPDQADGNGDGVGDACEDFDADGIVNSWDNCPTTTNSRQVDKNGNGVGDVCDGSQTTPCFLKPDSLGGPISAGPSALLGVLLAGSVGALVIRRRRRR